MTAYKNTLKIKNTMRCKMNFIDETKRSIKKKIFGEMFENASLQDFDFDGEWSLLKNFLKTNPSGAWFAQKLPPCLESVFFVESPVGTGKTHLAAALFESFCSPFGTGAPGCKYLKEDEFYRMTSNNFSIDDLGEKSEFSSVFSQSLIILDDVGSTWRSEDRKKVMISFLNNRCFKKTILLSSKSVFDFCDFVGIEKWMACNMIERQNTQSLRRNTKKSVD